MRNHLFFYKRTRYPADEEPHYYNVTKGFAGFNRPQQGEPIFAGTIEGFEEYLDTRKRPSVRISRRGDR